MADKRIGIIGLGNMGRGMCETLVREGFNVFGVDVDNGQRQLAKALGVTVCDSPRTLCSQTQQLILSLPKAEHVESVILGADGVLAHAQPNTLVLDTSTSKPEVSQQLAITMQQSGHCFLDTPVSGGPSGAQAGTMVMLVGGDEGALGRAKSILTCLSSKWVYLGGSGCGHAAKLINNLLCAAHLLTTAEAVAIGQQVGLSADKLLAGVNAGSGRSGVSEVNFPKWVLGDDFDSGFSMGLMRKDLELARQLIAGTGLDLTLSEQVLGTWQASNQILADNEDFNRVIEVVDGMQVTTEAG
ncbi:MAG: NAD(P)-dependent oxidoreductase [Gammaproteobacteria bacterium]|nr:NAD(P)-dependent oxidoreductase [Gammaproteobacteria bacterium]